LRWPIGRGVVYPAGANNRAGEQAMIKATGKGLDGMPTLFVGLSFENLDRLRAAPGDGFIRISGDDVNLPFDVMIFSGETEAAMVDLMKAGFGPDTTVTIDPAVKN
jgi:hypothetical protein